MKCEPGGEQGELQPDRGQREGTLLRRNLRYCIAEGLVALPILFLTLPANFIVANLLTQTFGLGESVFGMIVSLPAWCNVAQMVLMPVMGRLCSQKLITLIFSWLHLGAWLAIGFLLPFVPTDDPAQAGRIFFLLFALSSFFQSMVGIAWTSWVQEWIPARMRGKFFGQRNRALQLAMIVFLIGGGWVITRLQSNNPVLGFQVVVAVAILLRAVSILWQQRILATAGFQAAEKNHRFLAQLSIVRRAPSLATFVAFGASFGLAAGFLGPFFMVFLYEVLGASVGQVSLMVVTASLTGALSLPAWGRLLDRFGSRPVMLFVLFPWTIIGSFWAAVDQDRLWVLYLIYASGGLFSAGFVLGSFNLLLKLVPPEAKTTAISLHVAVVSLASALAPILGGALLTYAWSLGWDKMRTYHFAAVVHYGLILSTALVLCRVVEPKSSPLSQVIGAMRSYRQVGALLGLTFLVNFTFTKKEKRRRDQSVLVPGVRPEQSGDERQGGQSPIQK